MENCFDSKRIVREKYSIHVIEIREFDTKLINYINEHFVSVCKGRKSGWNIEYVKKEVKSFYEKKSIKTRYGATAEFFIHLYLKRLGYLQECMFLNLEENSIKKGFDGFYSKDSTPWIMESKSGSIKTAGISHVNKIKEAYNDMTEKITNGSNPWSNTYNHANSRDVDTDQSIVDIVKKLSEEAVQEKEHQISDFNLIPTATLFFEDKWEDTRIEQIETEIQKIGDRFKCNDLIIICCSKLSLRLFMDFLGVKWRES